MLTMRNLSKAFGPTVALQNVSLKVAPGEVLALVGENGAGKSTLMKILSGAHTPDSGEMTMFGEKYAPRNPGEARTAGVAMLYQELSLAPHLTLTDNVFLGCECCHNGLLQRQQMRKKAQAALRRAGLEALSPDTQVYELSAAQCQQAELARALASGCRVLVLDEPTSSLTRPEIQRLFELIRDCKHQGMAVIYISHFLEEVREIADQVTVLCNGRAMKTASMTKISDAEIVQAMVGRSVEEFYPRSDRTRGDRVLEVRGPNAVFEVHRGEILGIAGLIGAGRTELLEAIFGLRRPQTEEVRLFGRVGKALPGRRWRDRAGFLSEDRKRQGLAVRLTVADNLTLTRLPVWTSPRWRRSASERWIQKMSVKCAGPDTQVLALSGGNQQKVALARLLYHDAELLILDEPTRGIDVGAKALIYKLLDDLATGQDGNPPRAILMVSSYLPELIGICDRIAVMRRGKLGTPRPVSDWNEHSLMKEAIK